MQWLIGQTQTQTDTKKQTPFELWGLQGSVYTENFQHVHPATALADDSEERHPLRSRKAPRNISQQWCTNKDVCKRRWGGASHSKASHGGRFPVTKETNILRDSVPVNRKSRWANGPSACWTLSADHLSNQLPVCCHLFQILFTVSVRGAQTHRLCRWYP